MDVLRWEFLVAKKFWALKNLEAQSTTSRPSALTERSLSCWDSSTFRGDPDLNHQPPCLHIRVTFKLKLASTSTCQGPAHLVTHAVVAPTARYTVIHARLDDNTVGLTQDELEAVERAVHSFNAIRASVDSALPLDTSWANPISEVGRPQQHCLALSPQSAIGRPGTTGRVYQSNNEFSGSGTRPVPLHHLKSATQSH
ncbi:hypothetical protein K438DRAFT_1787954 [Mycena galopus ATCC 62051]|nr:hypothetical protein K438DRAFT_1787954 [Mycena galopus ATCC 62051]